MMHQSRKYFFRTMIRKIYQLPQFSTKDSSMEITEVKVYPAKEGKLKAYATMVVDNCFIIRDLKIIESDKGLFVSMPSRRKKDGTFKDVAHPLNAETRKEIEQKIIVEYNRVVETGDFATPEE